MNKVLLMGRLTRNPEMKNVGASGDTPMAKYTLAVDRRYRGSNSTEADFIQCIAFGKGAEFAMKHLKRGTKIIVCGRIQTGSYVGSDDKKVYTINVIVDEHYFPESKPASKSEQKKETDEDGFMKVPEGEQEELPFN